MRRNQPGKQVTQPRTGKKTEALAGANVAANAAGGIIEKVLDKGPKDPFGIVESIFGIATIIYQQVQLVKANKAQFVRISERIGVIESAIRGLDQIPDSTQYRNGLIAFHSSLKKCLAFIQEFGSKHWFKKIICAGAYTEKFDNLNLKLKQAMSDLNLGLQVQQIMNREQDKQDQQQDLADISRRHDEIISLQQKSMEEIQKLDLAAADRHKILEAQLASIRGHINKLNIGVADTGKAYIDKRYIIPFYDLVVDGIIKQGTFASIYLGKWCEQQVAIKMLEGVITPEDQAQFVREVEIMSRLKSPYITQFQGACLEQNRAVLVMEYMEQGSLYDTLAAKKFAPEQQKQLALDIAKGLFYLHKQGIIHRDLKSQNILVNQYNQAKLTDFGLSKISSKSVATIAERSTAFQWMAPELFKHGVSYTEKSDIYAYGVILWEILSGKKPYIGLESREIAKRTQAGRTGEEITTEIPAVYASLIKRCWAQEPIDRPELAEIIHLIEAYNPSLQGKDLYKQGLQYEEQKDYRSAEEVYTQAAAQGFGKAYTNLGFFSLRGVINTPNKKQAYELMLKGAQGGHARAQFNVAQMLEYGDGVEKDLLQAKQWYQEAAKQGNTNAIAKLSRIEEKLHARSRCQAY